MKISRRWLSRHLDLAGLEAGRIAEDLGLTTAEIERVEAWPASLSGVVVGEVLECGRHPNAERLSVTKVAVGQGTLDIVCGASNVARGQKVAVAPPGTSLPGEVRVEKAKIRGVESHGMILSEREMGIGEEHDGILVLPAGAKVGTALADALDLRDDVLEIDNKSITHRPDLWGHYGFARELAAIYGRPLAPPPAALRSGPGEPFPVKVADEDLCPLYLALPFEGARNSASPLWLKRLLLAVGQRPLGAVVDLTNFVMLDLGEPTHAFDRKRLRGGRIEVRRAKEGERMKTLDGVERAFTREDLLIADGEGPVAVAGVMGGEASEVRADTGALVLECAAFHPVSVRRTAQRLGLRTEASARFEKSLDPTLVDWAASRFVELLPQVCPGARVTGPATRAGHWKFSPRTIPLRAERTRGRLGVALPTEKMAEFLRRLQFSVEPAGADLRVGVPSFRATKDVTIEDDLVEEIGRMLRYGNIPPSIPSFPARPPAPDEERMLARAAADALAGPLGFREAYGYTFLADEAVEALALGGEPFVRVRNPIAENLSRIRRDLLPSLLGFLPKNLLLFEEVRLFEIGKGSRPETSSAPGEPLEVHEIAAVWASRTEAREGAFGRARGIASALLERLRVERVEERPFDGKPARPFAHPVRGVRLGAGAAAIGFAAELDPRARRALGLPVPVALVSLDLRAILGVRAPGRRFRPIPRFPAVKVDVALALPERVPAARVEEAVRGAAAGLSGEIELFDLFRGGSLGAGRKSLAFHVTLVSDERTLTEEDSARFLDRVEAAAKGLGGELRRA